MIRLTGVLLLLLFAATTVTADECILNGQGLTTPPAVEAGPTALMVRVYVIDIIEIADAEQSFTADVFLRVEWDDPRLKHSGPGACFISIARVWHPRLQVLNRRIVENVMPRDLEVTPGGRVIQVKRGFGKFSFRADYTQFPFDEQELEFNIQSAYGEDQIEFVVQPDLIAIADNLTTANWQIELAKHRVFSKYLAATERHHAGLDIVMHAKRRTGYYTWQELLPLFLVVMMSWVIFWIPREFVPPRIGLAATAMLTLMAYRFAVSKVFRLLHT